MSQGLPDLRRCRFHSGKCETLAGPSYSIDAGDEN